MDLAVKYVSRNKLPFLPTPTHRPHQVKPVPGASKAIAYYPGCSLHSTSREFNVSTQAVCKALDLNLVEPDGWVCCGSSAAHRADPEAALRLPMENLAIIEQSGFEEVTMPCAACFSRHKAALYEIRHSEDHKEAVEKAIGYEYQDSVRVSSLGETIFRRVGPEQVTNRVKQPLKGLRGVLLRLPAHPPPQITEAGTRKSPAGCTVARRGRVIDWSSRPPVASSIPIAGHRLEPERSAGPGCQAIWRRPLWLCPLCHTNLDARQFQMKLGNEIPILYFTQLMVLALGLPEKSAALNKNIVDPRPLLRSKGFITG
jgi:heterodisulfide reductase subunit B